MSLPQVQSFQNYRTYLKQLFAEEKESTSGVTLAKFAKTFGMSLSSLKMIMDGSRNLTIPNIHVIAHSLRLDEPSLQYFEALVLHDQSINPHEKTYYSRRLQSLRNEPKAQTTSVRLSESRIVSQWYLPALLIYLIDVVKVAEKSSLAELDWDALSAAFEVSVPELKKAIEHFEQLGLLQAKTEENIHFIFDKVSSSFPQRKYLKDVFVEGLRRMEAHFESHKNYFKAHTFSIDRRELQNLRVEYAAMIDRYMALTHPGSKDLEVIQVNCQIFPISH